MDDTAAAAPHLPATEDTVLPAAAATSPLPTPDPLPAATADAVEEGQPGADSAVPPSEMPLRQRDIDRILHNAQKTHRTAVKTLEAHEGIAVLPLSSWGTESSRPSRDAQE